MSDVVIVSAKRTPIGAFQGMFSNVKATTLGATAIKGALEAINLSPDSVDDVYMGCVLPAGLGQAPARQAALESGLARKTPCTTVNKVCGSGMKSIMLGVEQIRGGSAKIVVAGGMENMTGAPFMLLKGRTGYRLGTDKLYDHMILDGLEDSYGHGGLMGTFAETTADKYKFTREQQDAFAMESSKRAKQSEKDGVFKDEIVSISLPPRKKGEEPEIITQDETPSKVSLDKIPQLKPAFRADGTVTAANSSSISDGAAAVVLMDKAEADHRKLPALAVVKGQVSVAQDPEWFTTAPVAAIEKVCKLVGWSIDDVDLFEINEAFAVVTMAAMHDLKIPHEKVNIFGGACALGHPIGASGARILVTLIYALRRLGKTRGIATLCIGGGEAVAMAIEVPLVR